MVFSKPPNMSYADMAVYIENHAFDVKTEHDQYILYQYLYLISYMLIRKYGYFRAGPTAEDFAVYVTNLMFYRVQDKTLEKIKNVKNYIGAILFHQKLSFIKKYQPYEAFIDDCGETTTSDITYFSTSDWLHESAQDVHHIEVGLYLKDIAKSIKAYVNLLPAQNESERLNLYISCLLSILSTISLSTEDKKHIDELKLESAKSRILTLNPKWESPDDVILYHLPENMRFYIFAVIKRIRSQLVAELNYGAGTEIPEADIRDLFFGGVQYEELY